MSHVETTERSVIRRVLRERRVVRRNPVRAFADHLVTGLAALAVTGLLAAWLPELLLVLLGSATVVSMGSSRP